MASSSKKKPARDIYAPEAATLSRTQMMTPMEKYFQVKLDSGAALGHKPGQFVEVSIPGIGEAPISISSSPGKNGTFDLVVRSAGNVTRALHGLGDGAKVGIRGPFGTHFPVDAAMKGKDLLFICGGIGLVPVRSAIQYVLDHPKDYGPVTILIGTRTPSDRLFIDELESWKKRKQVALLETVDRRDASWKGPEGVITTLMPQLKIKPASTAVVVCGPPIMYKFVLIQLRGMKVADDDIYVSLERHMKCGVGKCGHCQINHLYVCQDGPVFRLSDVTHLREAF